MRSRSLVLLLALAAPAPADDWPQWLGPRRAGGWRETGAVEKFPPGAPRVRWQPRVGAGYPGPAVAGDRVYVSDYVVKGGSNLPPSGFSNRGRLPGAERVLCLD